MNESTFTTRYNIMDISSMEEFANIKGGVNDNSKDVYFMRAVGINSSFLNDILKMDSVLSKQMSAGQGKYKRMNTLPGIISTEAVDYYSKCYEAWMISGRKEAVIKSNEKDREWQQVLGMAFDKTLTLFGKITPNTSASMEKNFAVKLLHWYDEIAKDFITEWNPRCSEKLVISEMEKKQEYLFCYFLTLTGIDVLLLQYKADIDEQMDKLNLSGKMVLGEFNDCVIPDYQALKNQQPYMQEQDRNRSGSESYITGSMAQNNPSTPTVQQRNPVISINDIRRPDRDRRTQEQLRQNTGGRKQEQTRQNTGSRTQAGLPWQQQQGNRNIQQAQDRRELEFEELALLASSVVMIAIHDKRGEVIGTGSGIMIGSEGYILTNNHVASGGMYFSVKIEDDDTIYKTEEVIKYNPVLDLAVIRIQRRLQPIPVYKGGKKLVRGQKVVAIGSPLGMFNSVSDGIISGFRNIDNVDMIQFTAPTSHGSSGGAVLNMYGEVIGISTAGMDRGQNINLAVGYECINNFIRGFV